MSLDLSHSRVKIGTLGMQMKRTESDVMRLGLFHYYNSDRPQVHLNPREQGSTNTTYLLPYADLYNYALLDERRITPTTRATWNTAGSSLIQARFNDEACAGEVRAVFVHRQPGVAGSEQTVLLLVEWMEESPYTPINKGSFIWNKFRNISPKLGINTWVYREYEDPKAPGSRPIVIPFSSVQCQLSRGTLEHTDPWLWITTTMDRYPTSLLAHGFGDMIPEESA
ncbi:hypothetical protein B0H13DRAFT_1867905 [Mycena leptocephala]|nr:hypothetical protein B0H13DRAFT_1867905 [Mycena leptocephala]